MSRELPDRVHIIIETAVDDIMVEMEKIDMRGPVRPLIEREFRLKLREIERKVETE